MPTSKSWRRGLDGRPGPGRHENVFVERFWLSVEYEDHSSRNYADAWEAERSLRKYFDYDRNERIDQALGCRTPAEVSTGG